MSNEKKQSNEPEMEISYIRFRDPVDLTVHGAEGWRIDDALPGTGRSVVTVEDRVQRLVFTATAPDGKVTSVEVPIANVAFVKRTAKRIEAKKS